MSVTVTYYRLPAQERESVTRDQSAWEQFRRRIQSAHFQSFHSAAAGLDGFSGSREERYAKLAALLQEHRDPRRFDMEKDWHIVGYLLTGRAEMIEEHRPDDLLHSVIFGGHNVSVITGYGAVRYYDGQLVTQLADALRAADRKSVSRRFEPARMRELDIYAPTDEGEREAV
ncbi:MAG TPA: DUF1877 family protein, partial [Tepidisphaeraceae bacterium]|nr:DUF1877 family protein [Tepidisphaeraceae bacterium]